MLGWIIYKTTDADLTPEAYAAICRSWIEGGATIVGGCCQMFPEHVEALAALSAS